MQGIIAYGVETVLLILTIFFSLATLMITTSRYG